MQHILTEVERAEALAAQSRTIPRGRLRINAPVTFGSHELAKALPNYLRNNPEVDIGLTLADRMVDLIDEGFDVAFRVGVLADSGLTGRCGPENSPYARRQAISTPVARRSSRAT